MIHELRGHTAEVRHAAWSPDGKQVATASRDDTVRVWDSASGKPLMTLAGQGDDVTHVAFSSDGGALLSTGGTTARLWNPGGSGLVEVLRGHESSVQSVAYSPDDRRLLSAPGGWAEENDGTARLWNVETGGAIATLRHGKHVTSARFAPDGKRVLTSSRDGTMRLWQGDDGAPVRTIDVPNGEPVHRAVFSPNGKRIAAVSGALRGSNHLAHIWDAETGALLHVLRAHRTAPMDVVFSPDGTQLATTSNNESTTWLWNPATGERLRSLTKAFAPATYSPTGAVLATVSPNNQATLWNPKTGEVLHVLKGHEGRVREVAFSPDGRLAATASEDATVGLWDVATGQRIRVLRGHGSRVNCVSFSPDGLRLASGSGMGDYERAVGDRIIGQADLSTARIWNVATGEAVAVFEGHERRVRSAVFSADRRHLATASEDATVRIWTVFPSTQDLDRPGAEPAGAQADR